MPSPGTYKGVTINDGTDAQVAAQMNAVDKGTGSTPTAGAASGGYSRLPTPETARPITTPSAEPTQPASTYAVPDSYGTASRVTQVQDPNGITKNIREQQLASAQASIDAANREYDLRRNDVTEQGSKDLSRTNALSALMGLTGSSSAESRAGATEARTAKNLDAVEAGRQATLAGIYAGIENNARQLTDAALRENRANAKEIMDRVAQGAMEATKGLASTLNGATWDEFKKTDPDAARQLLEQSGQSEYAIRALWNESIAPEYKPHTVDASYQLPDGTTQYRTYEVNPRTGESSMVADQKIAIPFASYNPKALLSGANGEKYVPSIDADGNMVYKPIGLSSPVTLGQGQALFDRTTGDRIAYNPKTYAPKTSGGGSSGKKYTATNIPNAVRDDLVADIQAGHGLNDLYGAYKDVNSSYINQIYKSLKASSGRSL